MRFLGWQPDDVIRDHYRRCRALLFPGEEDFGIVPIEALACGTPGDRSGTRRRGRDGRRPRSAGPTEQTHVRRLARRDRRLGRPGLPPRPGRGPPPRRSAVTPVFRERILKFSPRSWQAAPSPRAAGPTLERPEPPRCGGVTGRGTLRDDLSVGASFLLRLSSWLARPETASRKPRSGDMVKPGV